MGAPARTASVRRRRPASKAGLRLVVYHSSPDVKEHLARLRKTHKFRVTCYSQRVTPIRPPSSGVDAVLWELAPGRRPNWRRLNAIARGIPIVSYSASHTPEVLGRSRQIGFACHLNAPLNPVEIEHQVALASPVDLATRFRQFQPTLKRYLYRVEVIGEMMRTVNASLDPDGVADALVSRAAAWLPAPCWAVVGPDPSGSPKVMAERGLLASSELAVRALGSWVLRHSEEYASANLRNERRTPGAPDVAAVALPLMCRGRTVAALVGVDRAPSPQVPKLSATTLDALHTLLEPAAIALDNAYRIQRAEALSVTDDLTQLYNSRYLSQVLRREAKRASRSGQPLSLLFIDLDGFKGVNDMHGHLYGSRALVEASALIRESARETDIVARFGGDEFAVVLPDTGSEGAVAVGDRVRERVSQHVFLQEEGINFRLTASAGVATLPDIAASVDELLQAADDAMYWVKAHGKDGIQLAGVVG